MHSREITRSKTCCDLYKEPVRGKIKLAYATNMLRVESKHQQDLDRENLEMSAKEAEESRVDARLRLRLRASRSVGKTIYGTACRGVQAAGGCLSEHGPPDPWV